MLTFSKKTARISGFDTNVCVLQSALELFESKKFRPVVLAPFCSSHSGLALMEKAIGKEQIWTE